MFEKSLYDLIRGLRNHKGNERAYIQDSIRECRREIKGQDMDLKATALLKLTYLEMFGHDMSWASFNVLEVMSSSKYAQKRVGYLGAVQSFRPDTEVLMLAENLLKKDLTSPHMPVITLPLIAIPHVISAPMANSLLSDLLPRLSHSNENVRKKTIVTLYRLALVYPETLRPAWPKIKERLSDESESPSVIAAIINVVCELGWRRPQDFLPLAPRLFDLLVEGNNNWMAIKIIKLFATLIPLEPRLTKKLLPPLITIIKSTPAMSLLYECINGIIQGGILQNAGDTIEGDELARLCVGKLRGMLVLEGDPNLKYVALLAFQQIVLMHPYLVSMHEDVILECIDDPDTSIRLRAVDLAVGMVNAQNLKSIVDRLITQLRKSGQPSTSEDLLNSRVAHEGVTPAADSDDEGAEHSIRVEDVRPQQPPPLPVEYRVSIISKILDMCSRSTYANISDFDWYVQVLLSLVKQVPATKTFQNQRQDSDMGQEVGTELRNVAVRVRSSRREAVQVAESLIAIDQRPKLFPTSGTGAAHSVLGPLVWIVGEYPDFLSEPSTAISSLIHPDSLQLPATILAEYLRAAMKLFAFITGAQNLLWTPERKTLISLLLARLIHFLEPLSIHPDIDVQEQSVQYLELLRLANEAVSAQATDAEEDEAGFAEPPLLLTQAIPSLFTGPELNPVARDAQSKVPVPLDLDLAEPINPHLSELLQSSDSRHLNDSPEDAAFHAYYYRKPPLKPSAPEPASKRLQLASEADPISPSYQNSSSPRTDAPDSVAAAQREFQRRQRHERNRDDPFYIPSEGPSGVSTPVHEILKTNNGQDLDIDSIPIMELNLDDPAAVAPANDGLGPARPKGNMPKPAKKPEILGEETLDVPSDPGAGAANGSRARSRSPRPASVAKGKALLQVDSSGLGSFALHGEQSGGAAKAGRVRQLEIERKEVEEAEMAAAMREVERLRLEMERAQERIGKAGGEGETVVRRKKKTQKVAVGEGNEGPGKKVRKKKVKKKNQSEGEDEIDGGVIPDERAQDAAPVKKKKKKRRVVDVQGEGG